MLKVFSVIIGGFFFTLFTTAWSVLGIRKLVGGGGGGGGSEGGTDGGSVVEDAAAPSVASDNSPPPSPPPKPFSPGTKRALETLCWMSGASAVFLLLGERERQKRSKEKEKGGESDR